MNRACKIFLMVLGLVAVSVTAAREVPAAEVTPLLKYYAKDYWVLLGGSHGDKWLPPEAVARELKGGEGYRVYAPFTFLRKATGAKAGPWGEADPEFLVRMKRVDKSGKNVLAVGGTWDAMPRRPRIVERNLEPYVNAARDILKTKSIHPPKVKITRVAEIDLDGDGENEVLVSAEHFSGANALDSPKPGDFSMVFLRKTARGRVSDTLLDGFFRTSAETDEGPSTTWRIVNVLDCNGDGVMEIVVGYAYYEGGGAAVYRIKGDAMEKVLGVDWGL